MNIGEAAKYVGRKVQTLQVWDRKGILKPASRTATNLLRQAMPEVTHGERPALVISEISDVTKLDSLNRESYKFI